jgi:hypothetical protein
LFTKVRGRGREERRGIQAKRGSTHSTLPSSEESFKGEGIVKGVGVSVVGGEESGIVGGDSFLNDFKNPFITFFSEAVLEDCSKSTGVVGLPL